MKIENLKQISEVSSSQWEFTTDGNRLVYVRYRWGQLSVYINEEGKDPLDYVSGELLYCKRIGHGFDNKITWEEIETKYMKEIDKYFQNYLQAMIEAMIANE